MRRIKDDQDDNNYDEIVDMITLSGKYDFELCRLILKECIRYREVNIHNFLALPDVSE